MARTDRKQAQVWNNYVTLRLTNRLALAANDTDKLLDRLVLPSDFRVSQVAYDAVGLTAVVNARIDTVHANTVISTGVPKVISPANLTQGSSAPPRAIETSTGRWRRQGSLLELRGTADGTGVAPIGSISCWVHGYFTRPITLVATFAERGQMGGDSPAAGYYDFLPLYNLRANANQAARQECALLVPYQCRVMSLNFDLRGHTETTGAITGDIRKNDVSILDAALDWDVNETFLVDFHSTPTFVNSAARNFVKGDELSLYIASGLSDSVPIGVASCHVLVWVQDHIRDANAEPNTED